jgi:hypothetical protein
MKAQQFLIITFLLAFLKGITFRIVLYSEPLYTLYTRSIKFSNLFTWLLLNRYGIFIVFLIKNTRCLFNKFVEIPIFILVFYVHNRHYQLQLIDVTTVGS